MAGEFNFSEKPNSSQCRDRKEELEAIAMTEPMIREALKAEVLFKHDKAAWWEYEKAEKSRRDRVAIINAAENRGVEKGKVEDIRNLMESFNISAEKAMAALKIPEADYPKYEAKLQ